MLHVFEVRIFARTFPAFSRSFLRPYKMSAVENVNAAPNKRPLSQALRPKTKKIKMKKYKAKAVDSTSPLGVLQFEIGDILKEQNLTKDKIFNDVKSILNDLDKGEGSITQKYHREVENVEILRLSSNGDGLAVIDNPVETDKKQIAIVPFGLPGDIVTVKVFKTHPDYVECDTLAITTPSEMRNDDLIKCKYFGKCSGCQFQSLTYSQQLEMKKNTIVNAYNFFAPLLIEKSLLPVVGSTIASPKQFGYRTKLTPHFDMPRRLKQLSQQPPLGFGQKGRPKWRTSCIDEGGSNSILDIEECVIGTDIINTGMKNERNKFKETFTTYKKGATILLRENTVLLEKGKDVYEQVEQYGEGSKSADKISYIETKDTEHDRDLAKICITNSRQIVTEYVDGYTFKFSGGEFFQNNNSILPAVTKYVRDNLQLPGEKTEPRYLVDCYCGSGLFSICSAEGVDKVVGVEISADSVAFAQRNAKANGIENCTFIAGKAEKLFESIDVPCDRTSVILDPPRKGCDELFLDQLAEYNPARIVYISCNVHSQARDIQYFLTQTEKGAHYKVKSIRGFDFFPQTHHVESVAVLSRID